MSKRKWGPPSLSQDLLGNQDIGRHLKVRLKAPFCVCVRWEEMPFYDPMGNVHHHPVGCSCLPLPLTGISLSAYDCFAFVCVCIYSMSMSGTHEGQRRVLDILETAVGCHMGA